MEYIKRRKNELIQLILIVDQEFVILLDVAILDLERTLSYSYMKAFKFR